MDHFSHENNGNERATDDLLNAVSMFEMKGYMANTLLRDADQMGMAHSLEIRVPFIDTGVVPFVLSLPGSWKVGGPGPKPLLREALGDLLPELVWNRNKMGFTLPFERWMHSSLNGEVDRTISDPDALRTIGITCTARHIWERFNDKPRTERWSRPWAIHVLRKWCELNNVSI
jgi:asparagine synthase (glutamine-hydrolysing)